MLWQFRLWRRCWCISCALQRQPCHEISSLLSWTSNWTHGIWTGTVGLLLALHLLLWLTCHLLISVIIGLNNQAAIHLLVNQESKPAHYLHQEIGETLVFPVKSDHVMDPWDFMFNTYKALASITRPASGLQGIVIIWNTDDIFYWITFL